MSDESINNVGKIYREVRIRRELAIKQVKQGLHSSAVSHFEHDNNDIRVSNLVMLLSPTLMSVDEFTQLVNIKALSIESLLCQISQCYDCLDIQGIEQLQKEYSDVTTADTPHYLLRLVIESYLNELEGTHMVLSYEDSSLVEEYLMEDGRWFAFEYIVFANLAYGLPTKTNEKILKKMIREYTSFHLQEYTDLFLQVYYHLSIALLEKGEIDAAENTIKLIGNTRINNQVLYIKHHIAFLELVLAWLKAPNSILNKDMINEFLDVTKLIDHNLHRKNLGWLKSLGYTN